MSRFTPVLILPKRFAFVILVAILLGTVGTAYAISRGGTGGTWPKSWPTELEPLRKQAWTWEHGFGGMSYDIPFANRAEFEAAWPHILTLKSPGASITLLRGPHLRVGSGKNAGVCVIPPRDATSTVTTIRLVVDGEIVDLNRISLPLDTPIIDERFKDEKKK